MPRFPNFSDFDAQTFIDGARRLLDQPVSTLDPAGNVHAPPPGPPAPTGAQSFFDRLSIPENIFGPRSPGSVADIGWLLKQDPNYLQRDMSTELVSLHKAAKARQPVLPHDANNFAYLFVPGLFTKHYPGYMSENVRRLKERGCTEVSIATIDTDQNVAFNAAALKTQIEKIERESGKKVVLVGHSKGGVDAGAALQLYPELQSKVQAFVSLQAPFGGTPIASDINESPHLATLMKGFISQVFRGDPGSLTDLSYKARRELLGNVTFTANVPTFSMASSSEDPGSLTALGGLYGRTRYNKPGDGLVLRDDAIIPGSRGIVILDELDHAGPAMAGGFLGKYRPGDLTEAMIALALKHSRG